MKGEGEAAAVALKELQEFIEKARLGRIDNDDITRFARLFKVCLLHLHMLNVLSSILHDGHLIMASSGL